MLKNNKTFRKSKHLSGISGSASTVNVDAVKAFWGLLDAADKLRVLTFDDQELVERVTSIQKDLSNSDMICYSLGIRGQDNVREEVGMNLFALECDSKSLEPVAFFAKLEFVEKADFFEHIELRLGRSFLKGRPMLPRRDWPSIFEPRANSWRSFMSQVLELVELAILQAQQDALSVETPKATEETDIDAVLAELLEGEEKSPSTRKKKKRSKRVTKDDADATAVGADDNDDADAAAVGADDIEASESFADADSRQEQRPIWDWRPESPPIFDWKRPTMMLEAKKKQYFSDMDSVSDLPDENASTTVSNLPDEVASTTDAPSSNFGGTVPEGEIFLNFDWNPEGPPIDETTEGAAVELEVDWSNTDSLSMETRWSAWLPNGRTGTSAEWHWVTSGPPTIAFVKNTFIDICQNAEERARPRSLPARSRPSDL